MYCLAHNVVSLVLHHQLARRDYEYETLHYEQICSPKISIVDGSLKTQKQLSCTYPSSRGVMYNNFPYRLVWAPKPRY